MANINYSYDGKGKSKSCELNMCIEVNNDSYTNIYFYSYGEDLSESLEMLIRDLLRVKSKIDVAVEEVLNKKINLLDTDNDNDTLIEERLTNYFTGDKSTKHVQSTIDNVIDNIVKEIIENG